MVKKRILCFGDSLTWGFNPENRERFPEEHRWPMVMQAELGDGYTVIEEAQNGRTIATEDPAEGEKNGLRYIGPCLESHTPLDYVFIMLGVNDCKRKFAYAATDIVEEMQLMLEKVLAYDRFRCGDAFQVILMSPPPVSEAITDSWLGDKFGYLNARKVSQELAAGYRQLAETYGCGFIDAGEFAVTSRFDGIHLDAEEQVKLGKAAAAYLKKKMME